MTSGTTLQGKIEIQYTEFDSPLAIFASTWFAMIGMAVFIGLPMYISALEEVLEFSEQDLGILSSADLGGVFLGSVLTSFLVTKINRQHLVVAGLLVTVAATWASMQTTEFSQLALSRLVAGLGGGVAYSTGCASLAGSHNTGRNFSIMLFGLVLLNVLEFQFFPTIISRWSLNGLYWYFFLLSASGLAFVRWLPPYALDKTESRNEGASGRADSKIQAAIPPYICWLCLIAVFCYYLHIGSFWTFIDLAASDAGMQDEFIGWALTVGTLFSLIGTAAAAWMAKRFGQSKPLLFSLFMMVFLMLILATRLEQNTFLIAIFGFNLFWIATDVFQLGTLSNIDHSGRYASLVPGAQGLGQTIAPILAGYSLSIGYGYSFIFVAGAFLCGVALMIYLFVYYKLKLVAPQVADSE